MSCSSELMQSAVIVSQLHPLIVSARFKIRVPSGRNEAFRPRDGDERRLGPRADVADHLGGGEAAEAAAIGQLQVARVAIEEALPHRDRRRRSRRRPWRRARDAPAPCRCAVTISDPASERVSTAISHSPRTAASASSNAVHLVERRDLLLVGEQDVDLVLDEVAEVGAMAVDAKGVGQGKRRLAPGLGGDARRRCETPSFASGLSNR